jgi:hypothetical protein
LIEIYCITNSTGDHLLALDNENKIAWWLDGGEDSFESMVARFHFTTTNEFFKNNNVPNQKLMEFYA